MSFILDALKNAEKAARKDPATLQGRHGHAAASPAEDDCLTPRGKDLLKEAGDRSLPGQRRIAQVSIAIVLLLAGALAMGLWLERGRQESVSAGQSVANDSHAKAIGTVKHATATAPESRGGPALSGSTTLEGEIAHHLYIVMRLRREGSNLSGSYYYVRIGRDIRLSGTIDDEGSVILEEFVNGEKTGTFRGRFVSNERMEGTWSKPGSRRSRDFFLLNSK